MSEALWRICGIKLLGGMFLCSPVKMGLLRDTRVQMNLLIKPTMWENVNTRAKHYQIVAFHMKCEACGFIGQDLSTHLVRRTVRPPWWCLQALGWKCPSPRIWFCLRLLRGFVADVRVLRFLQDVLRKTTGMHMCNQQTINVIKVVI